MNQLTEEQKTEFLNTTKVIMKFLTENYHPHTKCIIENDKAEIVESSYCTGYVDDYIMD